MPEQVNAMNIEDLISRYIDGELPSETEAELHHRLAVSPEARAVFRAQIALKALARDSRVLDAPSSALRGSLFDRLGKEGFAPPLPPIVPLSDTELHSARAGGRAAAVSSADHPPVRERRRRRAIAWFALPITAILIFIGYELIRQDGSNDRVMAVNGNAPMVSTPLAGAKMPDTAMPDEAATRRGVTDDEISNSKIPELTNAPAVSASRSTESGRSTQYRATNPTRSAPRRRDAPAERLEDRLAFAENPVPHTDVSDDDTSEQLDVMLGGHGPDLASVAAPPSAEHLTPDTEISPRLLGRALMGDIPPVLKADPMLANAMIVQQNTVQAENTQRDSALPQTMASFSFNTAKPVSIGDSGNLVAMEMNMDTVVIAQATPERINLATSSTTATRSTRIVIGARQEIVYSGRSAAIRPATSISIGLELNGGHRLHVVLGYAGYRQMTITGVESIVIAGVTYNDPASSMGLTPDTTTIEQNEFWGGVGYRYDLMSDKPIGIGFGALAGVGANFYRAGVDVSLVVRPSLAISIEFGPTLRYLGAIGTEESISFSNYAPAPGYSERRRTDVTLEDGGELQPGLMINLIVGW